METKEFTEEQIKKVGSALLLDYMRHLSRYITHDVDRLTIADLDNYCDGWVKANMQYKQEEKLEAPKEEIKDASV